MTRHILVAIDDSEPSEQALEYTLREYPDARITALHVLQATKGHPYTPDPDRITSFGEYIQQTSESRGEELGEAMESGGGALEMALQADEERNELQTVLRTGEEAEEIVAYTEEQGVGHVVIGSHGRDGISRILLGSIAEAVVRQSPVPVTVVR